MWRSSSSPVERDLARNLTLTGSAVWLRTTKLADDLPLFAAQSRPKSGVSTKGPSPIETALKDVAPDALTPREALETLYRLKALLAE